jgi:exosortase K
MREATWRRGLLLLIIVLAMVGLKLYYSMARVNDLQWILWPTAKIVGAISGIPFDFEPGAGYMSREHLFLIEKPCAGINFMIAALGMVGFVLSERAHGARASFGVLSVSLTLSYLAAVAVNTVRLLVALWLGAHPLVSSFWTAGRMHRVEGIAVYFGGLFALHLVARRLVKGPARSLDSGIVSVLRGARVPLFWYYAVALGAPWLHGAAAAGARFFEHGAFVLLVPPILVGLAALARSMMASA